MAYTVEFSRAGARDFRALAGDVKTRVASRIDGLARDPRPPGVKKMRGEDRTYRIRVGDHRIIYEIHDQVLIVLVVRVRHRRDAYR